MSEPARSEQACPVCDQHTLALDQPPEIDVMGVQAYSDMIGMGDLPTQGAVGIVCLTCDTHWRDKAAFDRGEVDPGEEVATLSDDSGAPGEVEPVDDGDGE